MAPATGLVILAIVYLAMKKRLAVYAAFAMQDNAGGNIASRIGAYGNSQVDALGVPK